LKFEVALLGVMIFLIGGILALIAVDLGQIQESPSGGLSQPQIGDEISVSVTKQPATISLNNSGMD